MTRIVVSPERLRSMGSYLKVNSENIYTLATQLRNATNTLDWETRYKTNIDDQVNAACKQARNLAAQLQDLSQFLRTKAQAFEDADRQSAEGLRVLDGSIRQFVEGSSSFLDQILGWGKNLWPFLMVPFLRISSLLTNQNNQSQSDEESNTSKNEDMDEYPKKIENLVDTTPQQVLKDGKWVDEQCVAYAKRRRPDLGPTGGTERDPNTGEVIKWGGPKDYLTKFEEKVFQITENDLDLRKKIAKGYAIIWDEKQAKNEYGHIAIVEEVGEDYVIVSDSNNPKNPDHIPYKVFLKDLLPKYIIP